MVTLYTYCIPVDDGAAPNPYWGRCTLAICKPVIRRLARVGDWIVGTGGMHTPIGDVSGHLVYAMEVTSRMLMNEYDAFTAKELPGKVPDWHHSDPRRRLGDSVYDFSAGEARLRESVHGEGNKSHDLQGKYVLLSDHFFYFGDKPVLLPIDLQPCVKQGQAHRSSSNGPYVAAFVEWIHGLGYQPNALAGKPQVNIFADDSLPSLSAACRRDSAEEDERIQSGAFGADPAE